MSSWQEKPMAEILSLSKEREIQRERWLELSRRETESGWRSFSGPDLFDYFQLNQLWANNEFQEDPPLTEEQLEEKFKARVQKWKERIAEGEPPFEIPVPEITWEKESLSFRDAETGIHYRVPGLTPKKSGVEGEPGRRL